MSTNDNFKYEDYEDVLIWIAYHYYMDNCFDDNIPVDAISLKKFIISLIDCVAEQKKRKVCCFVCAQCGEKGFPSL